MEQTLQQSTVQGSNQFEQRLTLDDLSMLRCEELAGLYEKGRLPDSLQALDGSPTGRMLAVRMLDSGPLARLLRRVAAWKRFVWAGKSFLAANDAEGNGINRIQAAGVLGRQDLFPFETHVGASALDGDKAIVLDYDLSDNPAWIRRVHDEVREVSPGVYLGPAMWKTRRGKVTLLWFALDTAGRQ